MKLPIAWRRAMAIYGPGKPRRPIDVRSVFVTILIVQTIVTFYTLTFGFPGLVSVWRRRRERIEYIDTGRVQVDASVEALVRPANDTTLINSRFSSSSSPRVCGGSKGILILINSAPKNTNVRSAIRRTWMEALISGKAEVLFFLGKSSSGIPGYIQEEAKQHHDMIVEDFVDSYTNLTLKSVLMLKWVQRSCDLQSLNFYAKFDDDIFINSNNLFRVLEARVGVKNIMVGNLICEASVVRQPGHKYYVPKEIHPGTTYPDYLSGTGYVISSDLIPNLFQLAIRSSFFPMEDIFITGFLRRQLNVLPTGHEGFVFCLDPNDVDALMSSVLVHCLSKQEKDLAWETVKNGRVPLVDTSAWACHS